MNTTMMLSYLKHERYENALDKKQGFVSAYTFLRERNHTFQGKTECIKNCVDLLCRWMTAVYLVCAG